MPRGSDPLYDPDAPPGSGPLQPPAPSPSSANGTPPSPAPRASGGRGSDPIYNPYAGTSPASPSPSSATPAAQDLLPDTNGGLGSMSIFEKPANVSTNDFLLAHLASLGRGASQIGQTADDYVRAATNTFGLGDRFAASMNWLGNYAGLPSLPASFGGGDLAQQRAKTAAAQERLGPAGTIAANMTGYGPLGAVGVAGKLGGGVLGAVGEGATAGALSGAGHSQDDSLGALATNAVLGGVAGAAAGVPVGLVSKAIAPGPFSSAVAQQRAAITSAAKDARDSAYAALDAPKYDQTELLDELDQVKNDLYANDPDGALPKAAPRSLKAFNDLYAQTANAPYKTQSASSILGTIQKLDDIPGHGAGMENDVAPFLQDRLKGVMANLDPVTAHSAADVQAMLDAADDAQKTFKNAQDLQQWGQGLKAFGASPAGAAQGVAEKYYGGQAPLWAINPKDPAAAQYAALQAVNKAAGGGGMTPYGVVHATRPLIEAGAGALGAGVGGPAGAVIGDALGGAIDYGVVKPLASKGLGWAASRGTQKAINQAYRPLTGQTIAPAPEYGRALRSLIFGNLAGSGY